MYRFSKSAAPGKLFVLIAFFLGSPLLINAQKNGKIVSSVDQPAYFPGGDDMLRKFIDSNIKTPDKAIRRQYFKTALVQVHILEDGTLVSINKLKFGLNQEAERLVSVMPKWMPARINSKPVKMRTTIAIQFKPKAIVFPNQSW